MPPIPSLAGMIAGQPRDALAIAANSFRLTYGQINERSEKLAQGLQLLGVGADTPVAVFAGRTPAGIVAALAVLKAGGAYVPLDPADPAERLDLILRDVHAPFVLAERDMVERLPKGAWKVIPLDGSPLTFSQPMRPVAAPAPQAPACVLYVSGPHGRPLGVEVTHAGLLNLVRWHQRTFKVTAADNASQFAAPGSDAAIWEIWPNLAAGASLHFPEPNIAHAAAALRQWLVHEYITIAWAPPDMAEHLIALPWPRTTALRLLLTSGDVLRQYPPAGLPFALVNAYGMAETAAVALSGPVPPYLNPREFPSIGRPVENTRAAVVNESLALVDDGESGELCISGPGLARGYVNQAALTARRFVTGLRGDPQSRWFRTGDRARRLSGGQITLEGGFDDQIRMQGQRVEPSEIEGALNAHPDVETSAVIVREDHPGERHLAAYFVPVPGAEAESDALRDWLEERLPSYMLPAGIVSLAELPYTPEGKLDRAALPPLPLADERPVRSAIEVRLARIIASVLEVDRFAMDDDIVQISGHPLLAALIIDRVRQVFGVTLSSRQLFESPSISRLAADIEQAALLAVCSK